MPRDLASIFQALSVMSPFRGLHSEFLQNKFYVNNMGLLVSNLQQYIHVGNLLLCSVNVLYYRNLLNVNLVRGLWKLKGLHGPTLRKKVIMCMKFHSFHH